jgi:hypothetical protein
MGQLNKSKSILNPKDTFGNIRLKLLEKERILVWDDTTIHGVVNLNSIEEMEKGS